MVFYDPTLLYLRVSALICFCCLHIGACGFISTTSWRRLALAEVPKYSVSGIFWIFLVNYFICAYIELTIEGEAIQPFSIRRKCLGFPDVECFGNSSGL